jgi:hypothetical protein
MRKTLLGLATCSLMCLLFSSVANAQWVMVARAASKRIQKMQQTNSSGGGFEVATVLLEAHADKVYETALAEIKQHPELTVTAASGATRRIDFTSGGDTASMMANSLGPDVTELVVAATAVSNQANAWKVVNGILKVCERMKVSCEVAQ